MPKDHITLKIFKILYIFITTKFCSLFSFGGSCHKNSQIFSHFKLGHWLAGKLICKYYEK